MWNTDYFKPALAAFIFAVGFPLFFILQLHPFNGNAEEALLHNLSELNLHDVYFLLLGCLEIYIYLSFRKVAQDRFGFLSFNAAILLFIISSVLFYFVSLVFDIVLALNNVPEGAIENTIWFSIFSYIQIISSALYGIASIVIAVILLRSFRKISASLKVFSIISLTVGFFGVSVALAFIAIVLMPLAMITLAIFFLERPTEIELV